MLIIFFLFTTLQLTISQTSYVGPATIDYFQQNFNEPINALTEIKCSDPDASWQDVEYYDNVWYGFTDASEPVRYYRLNITAEMKQRYAGELYISTCCDHAYCDSYAASIADEYPDATESQWASFLRWCNDRELRYIDYYAYGISFNQTDNEVLYDQYCSQSSLDTLIYIFQEKKDRINYFHVNEDSECSNTEKSIIDLSGYLEGDYIIGIGGYGQEYGDYYLQLECIEYSYPITEEQLDPPSTNTTQISCNDTIGGAVDKSNPVNYYQLNITESTYLPANISTDESASIYLFKEKLVGLEQYEIIDSELYFDDLSLSDYGIGVYWILVQGWLGYDAIYTLTMDCAPPPTLSPTIEPSSDPTSQPSDAPTQSPTATPSNAPTVSPTLEPTLNPTIHPSDEPSINPTMQPSASPTLSPSFGPTQAPTNPPKVSRELMMGMVFGSAACLLFLICAYYIYECVKYKKNKPKESEQDEAGRTRLQNVPTNDVVEFIQNELKKKEEEKTIGTAIELAETKQTPQTPQEPVYHHGDTNDTNSMDFIDKEVGDGEEMKEPTLPSRQSAAGAGRSVGGVLLRRLDSAQPIADQLEEDQDVIQIVLAHAIACCEDNEGFDIFQVLAIRKYAAHSRETRGFKPLDRFGIDFELVKLSPFFVTVVIAIVIGLTQTWGIFVVAEKLVEPYFTGEEDIECPMDVARWESVFSLKILAFLLSLVVTFYIGSMLDGIRHNGLYEILDTLELEHIKHVNHIALWIAQLGQAINYFVCLIAVLGSYFIIFSSNQGDDDGGYATAGLDMILNAVALFFMLELDDLMVSGDDYDDCGDHLKWILENYTPNLEMNHLYKAKSKSLNAEEKKENLKSRNKRTSTAASLAYAKDKCNHCMVPFMYYMINVVSVVVTVICYGGGFIAPFLIFFCW